MKSHSTLTIERLEDPPPRILPQAAFPDGGSIYLQALTPAPALPPKAKVKSSQCRTCREVAGFQATLPACLAV